MSEITHTESRYEAAWQRFKKRYGGTHQPMLFGANNNQFSDRFDARLKEAYAHAWNAALTDEDVSK